MVVFKKFGVIYAMITNDAIKSEGEKSVILILLF